MAYNLTEKALKSAYEGAKKAGTLGKGFGGEVPMKRPTLIQSAIKGAALGSKISGSRDASMRRLDQAQQKPMGTGLQKVMPVIDKTLGRRPM